MYRICVGAYTKRVTQPQFQRRPSAYSTAKAIVSDMQKTLAIAGICNTLNNTSRWGCPALIGQIAEHTNTEGAVADAEAPGNERAVQIQTG